MKDCPEIEGNEKERMIEVGVVQMSIRDGQVEENLETALGLISDFPGGQIYLLPELFTTGYAYEAWPAAGNAYEGILERLSFFSREVGAVICGSVIAREADGLFNRMVAVFPDMRPVVAYNKVHLFRPMKEEQHLRPGRSITGFAHAGLQWGMAVCYDLRFPSMFQHMAPTTDVFLVPSEWPEPRCETMKLMARARAAENQCYLVLSNRCGGDQAGTFFCGHSMIIGPDGRVMADAVHEQTVLRLPLFTREVRSVRNLMNVLVDRVDGIDSEASD